MHKWASNLVSKIFSHKICFCTTLFIYYHRVQLEFGQMWHNFEYRNAMTNVNHRQNLNSQNIPHISPSLVRYGIPIASKLEDLGGHVIMAHHCMWFPLLDKRHWVTGGNKFPASDNPSLLFDLSLAGGHHYKPMSSLKSLLQDCLFWTWILIGQCSANQKPC